jgi:hypothetical protein
VCLLKQFKFTATRALHLRPFEFLNRKDVKKTTEVETIKTGACGMWNVGAMVFIVVISFVSCRDLVPSQTGRSTTILCVVIASCVCVVLCALCVRAAGCSEHPRWLSEWENNIAMNLRGPECSAVGSGERLTHGR